MSILRDTHNTHVLQFSSDVWYRKEVFWRHKYVRQQNVMHKTHAITISLRFLEFQLKSDFRTRQSNWTELSLSLSLYLSFFLPISFFSLFLSRSLPRIVITQGNEVEDSSKSLTAFTLRQVILDRLRRDDGLQISLTPHLTGWASETSFINMLIGRLLCQGMTGACYFEIDILVSVARCMFENLTNGHIRMRLTMWMWSTW